MSDIKDLKEEKIELKRSEFEEITKQLKELTAWKNSNLGTEDEDSEVGERLVKLLVIDGGITIDRVPYENGDFVMMMPDLKTFKYKFKIIDTETSKITEKEVDNNFIKSGRNKVLATILNIEEQKVTSLPIIGDKRTIKVKVEQNDIIPEGEVKLTITSKIYTYDVKINDKAFLKLNGQSLKIKSEMLNI